MSLYTLFVNDLLTKQNELIKLLLNRKRYLGELISEDDYNNAFQKLSKSTTNNFVPIDIEHPYHDERKFSSYLLDEMISRIDINLDFINNFLLNGNTSLQEISDEYDVLLEQISDNYNKLLSVRNLIIPSPLETSLPLPMVDYNDPSAINRYRYLRVPTREGTETNVSKLSLNSVFPLRAVTYAGSILYNRAAGQGFDISFTGEAPQYSFLFKDFSIVPRETFVYFLQIEKYEDYLRYRASADGVYYGEWKIIFDITQYQPIYNDYDEATDLYFKIISKLPDLSYNLDWFFERREHTIKINYSTDYGFVKRFKFSLGAPTTVDTIQVSNFGADPFIIEGIEGSIDGVNFYDVSTVRYPVIDYVNIPVWAAMPVKYLLFTIKQETYDIQYIPDFNLDKILNSMVLNYNAARYNDQVDKIRYELGLRLVNINLIRTKIVELLNNKNFSDAYIYRRFVYQIDLNSITVNKQNVISEYLG